jgi:hypothetical protein
LITALKLLLKERIGYEYVSSSGQVRKQFVSLERIFNDIMKYDSGSDKKS